MWRRLVSCRSRLVSKKTTGNTHMKINYFLRFEKAAKKKKKKKKKKKTKKEEGRRKTEDGRRKTEDGR